MSDLIKSLLDAVTTREIDLEECSEMYAGVKLPVRVNWPRAWKKQRWTLSKEHHAIQDEYVKLTSCDAEPTKEQSSATEALSARREENAAAWDAWWSGVFMMSLDDTIELRHALPAPHWEWLTGRIIDTMTEYEVEETKKALGSRGRSSGEQEQPPLTSGTG
jgi:hypothetical protein